MTPSSLITIRPANSTSCNSNNSSSNNSNNNKNQNNNSNKKNNNNNKHNQQKPCVRHTMYVPLAASRCKAQVLAPTSAELPVAQPPKIEAFQVRDNPSVIWTVDVPGIPTRQPRPWGEKQTSREMALPCSERAGPSDSEAEAISPSSPLKQAALTLCAAVSAQSQCCRSSPWRSFLARPLPLDSCRMRCSASRETF